jgi:hypothetical protein
MNADLTAKCAYLFDTLKKNGVRSIEMSFSGSGDDGQMEWQNVDYIKEYDGSWDDLTIFNSYGNVKLTLGELVDEITEGVIDFYGVDYQNDEGNSGSVVFDVETGRISTTYQVYQTKEESLYI